MKYADALIAFTGPTPIAKGGAGNRRTQRPTGVVQVGPQHPDDAWSYSHAGTVDVTLVDDPQAILDVLLGDYRALVCVFKIDPVIKPNSASFACIVALTA